MGNTPPIVYGNISEGHIKSKPEMNINSLRKASENINESPGGDDNNPAMCSFTEDSIMMNHDTPDIAHLT